MSRLATGTPSPDFSLSSEPPRSGRLWRFPVVRSLGAERLLWRRNSDIPLRRRERLILTKRGHRRNALDGVTTHRSDQVRTCGPRHQPSLRLRVVINDSAWASGADGVCLWGFVYS